MSKETFKVLKKIPNLLTKLKIILSSYVNTLFTNTQIKLVCRILEENWDEIKESTAINNKYMYIEGIKL